MSKIAFVGNTSGNGVFTIVSPNGNTDRILTLPDAAGNVVTTGSSGVVTQGMLASGLAGNGPAFSAYLSTNQNISSSVFTKIQLNTEEFDTNSNYDNSTNYRFTPTVAGYYQINGYSLLTGNASTLVNAHVSVYKNGAEFKRGVQLVFSTGNGQYLGSSVTCLVYLNGSTDYAELYGFIGATSPYFFGGQQYTYFNGFLARAA